MISPEQKELIQLYEKACCGNADAIKFLFHWCSYVHAIDDIIDGDKTDPEHVISTLIEANLLYTLPFYRQFYLSLQPVVMLVTNAYADSVAWEKDPRPGRRQMADVLRFAGNEMLFAIAFICGGYIHLRSISAEVRQKSWDDHHDGEKSI